LLAGEDLSSERGDRHVFRQEERASSRPFDYSLADREWLILSMGGRIMRRCLVILVLGLWCLINPGVTTTATAEDRPASRPIEAKQAPEAKQAREKFAKLLLPDGPRKPADKAVAKRRGVVINAFGGGTRVILP
jgi:hypothetical protein